MVSFDDVIDAYDAGRPGYPPALFDALEPLSGRLVIEGGCGTGQASRELATRGARLVATDVGPAMVRHTATVTPGLFGAVVADGSRLPFANGVVDLLCFAQSWHWLDRDTRVAEAARVLTSGGRWAGWWSHARADGQEWFDTYWSLIEAVCPGTHRGQRDTDWGSDLGASGRFVVRDRITVPWIRSMSIDEWLLDEQSKSYVAELPSPVRERLLSDLRDVVREGFEVGRMTVPYETWLWIADTPS